MKPTQVKIDDVVVNYYEKTSVVHALRRISLVIEAGEFFVLLGPSGCGKTTLLRTVAGLIEPEDGAVYLDGKPVFSISEGVNTKPADREVSFVFQNIALYPHMTIRKNLEFPLKVRKQMEKPERERVVEGIASFLQIDHLLRRYPRQLSGGRLQRVAIGRAMVRDPKVFLMDEPMSNLDTELRRGIRSYFKQMQRKLGTTTIYVTHDQKEAMSLADRLAIMIDGTIQQIGTPREVYERPENTSGSRFYGRKSDECL